MTSKVTPMVETKPQIESVGMWGSWIAGLASGALTVSAWLAEPGIASAIPAKYAGPIAVVGAALAWYGRKYAKTQIKGIVVTP